MTPALSNIFDLVFIAVLVLAIIGSALYVTITHKDFFKKINQQMQSRGFVLSHTYQPHRGPVTWVWGRYSKPVPFYLHFSNRDPIAAMAGQIGIADIRLGHAVFDAAFYVRSNQNEWAKEFMTSQLCERLLQFESVEFITSSINNLLTPDYWPDEQERDQRDLWMLRTDGKLDESAAVAYIELAQELSTSLQHFCQDKSHALDACRSELFEGR